MLNIFNAKQAKQAARSLERFMNAKGHALKLGEALEALAQMSGNRNWAALSQVLTEEVANQELSERELAHARDAAENSYGDESALVVHTGFQLRFPVYAEGQELLDYVRVCDPLGREVAYWVSDEWEQDPQLVMGAILGALARGRSLTFGPSAGKDAGTPPAPKLKESDIERANRQMLEALEALLPYVESKSQPGERWAELCVRQTLEAVRPRVRPPVIQDVDFGQVTSVLLNEQWFRLRFHHAEEVLLLKGPQTPCGANEDPEDVESQEALGLYDEEDGHVFEESVSVATLRRLVWAAPKKAFVDPVTGDEYKFIYAQQFA